VAVLVTPAGNDPNRFALFSYDIRTDRPTRLDELTGDGVLSAPAWSPDGQGIAYYRVDPTSDIEPNTVPSQPALTTPLSATEKNNILPGFLWDMTVEKQANPDSNTAFEVRLVVVTQTFSDRLPGSLDTSAVKRASGAR